MASWGKGRRGSSGVGEKPASPTNGPQVTAMTNQLQKTRMCSFFLQGKCLSLTCRFAHDEAELKSRPDFEKTKMCIAFRQKGSCMRGDACNYAHGEKELRVTGGIYKTQMCIFHARGFCKKAEKCRHAHGVTDLRPVDTSKPAESMLLDEEAAQDGEKDILPLSEEALPHDEDADAFEKKLNSTDVSLATPSPLVKRSGAAVRGEAPSGQSGPMSTTPEEKKRPPRPQAEPNLSVSPTKNRGANFGSSPQEMMMSPSTAFYGEEVLHRAHKNPSPNMPRGLAGIGSIPPNLPGLQPQSYPPQVGTVGFGGRCLPLPCSSAQHPVPAQLLQQVQTPPNALSGVQFGPHVGTMPTGLIPGAGVPGNLLGGGSLPYRYSGIPLPGQMPANKPPAVYYNASGFPYFSPGCLDDLGGGYMLPAGVVPRMQGNGVPFWDYYLGGYTAGASAGPLPPIGFPAAMSPSAAPAEVASPLGFQATPSPTGNARFGGEPLPPEEVSLQPQQVLHLQHMMQMTHATAQLRPRSLDEELKRLDEALIGLATDLHQAKPGTSMSELSMHVSV